MLGLLTARPPDRLTAQSAPTIDTIIVVNRNVFDLQEADAPSFIARLANRLHARTRAAVIESVSQAFLLYDLQDQLILRNRHYFQLYPALTDVVVPGAKYDDVVRSEIATRLNVPIAAADQSVEYRKSTERHRERQSMFECQLDNDRWILVNERRTDDGGTIVLYTDISELKRSEKERLSILGQLTATVAHELRNPLSAIRNTLVVLREMIAGTNVNKVAVTTNGFPRVPITTTSAFCSTCSRLEHNSEPI